jgi:hypothetical protein
MQSAEPPAHIADVIKAAQTGACALARAATMLMVMIGVRNWIRTCAPHVRSVML